MKKAPKNTFTAVLEKFDSHLWYYYFLVPNEIATVFVSEKSKRVVCIINDSEKIQCALMHKKGGGFFINVNKKTRDKLKLNSSSEINVQLTKDDSKYGLPMPEELAELLKLDDEGNELFHSLTPGKQRTLLHIIGLPKGMDIRIRRAIAILNHLKENNGKIDYKMMNEAMKNKL